MTKLTLYINRTELNRQMRNKGYSDTDIKCSSSQNAFASWFANKNKKHMTIDHVWSKLGIFKDDYIKTGVTKEV